MAESGIRRVVFDPFILGDALLDMSPIKAPEREALDILIKQCLHRLVVDDKNGNLSSIYQRELGPRFSLIQSDLQELLGGGKAISPSRAQVTKVIPGLRRQHRTFILAALAVQPTYIVTRIRQVKESYLTIEHILREYSVRLMSASEFVAHLERSDG